MATITDAGVVARSLGSYRELLNERFRAAFGSTLAIDPETPIGQIAGVMALSLAEQDEVVVAQSNALSLANASGRQLDDLGALIGLRRNAATKSTVTATLGGVTGTIIPEGSRAASTGGDEFETLERISIGEGGTVNVSMRAVEAGAVEVAASSLTRIVTRVPGWTSVTNATPAAAGASEETDAAYRTRLLLAPNRLQRGALRALNAALIDAGATRVRVEENTTNAQVARQGLNIEGHGVLCIVLGGTDADIAAAVATKTLGASTSGSTSVGDINFERVAPSAVDVTVTTVLDPVRFPADGVASIKANIAAYALAAWQIGENVNVARLYTPANAIAGHTITSITATLDGGTALPANAALNVLYTLDISDITVTTS